MATLTFYICRTLEFVLFVFPIYLIVRVFKAAVTGKYDIKTELLYGAFAVYIIGAARHTLLPVLYNSGFHFYVEEFHNPNLIPLKTIILYTSGTAEGFDADAWQHFKPSFWIGHFLLSAPLIWFMQLFGKRNEKKFTMKKAVSIGAFIFTMIETVQYPIGRVPDIDDIIINTLGCMLGYWLYSVYEKHKESKADLVPNAA